MSWNGFGELDLSKVEQSEGGGGGQRLTTGTHVVKCTSAVMGTFGDKDQHKRVVADFVAEDGSGDIRFNFNLVHSNPQTTEIGLRQLKSFLIAGGHKNPDKPEDVATLQGLGCKISVGMGKPWTDQQGNQRQQTEIKSFSPLDGASSKKPSKDLDDEIPF